MKKNLKLTIILVVLVSISILIGLTVKKENRQSFDPLMFAIKDTTTIQTVLITSNSTNEIRRNNGKWRLNDKFDADLNTVEVLKSILSQVKIKRPVAKMSKENIVADLQRTGKKVSIKYSDGSEFNFIAGGNSAKKDSYYLLEDEAYLVEIPGYNNYISGIFELTENQWRDRVLFSSSWRSLQSLDIDYTREGEDLNIFFDQKFLAVKGVVKLDTTSLMDYMNQFQYFQINDFLEEGRYKKYDSLSKTEPLALLSVRDIDKSKNRELQIFPLMKGESFYLLTDEKDEMMVIDSKRMDNLLSKKDQFISK